MNALPSPPRISALSLLQPLIDGFDPEHRRIVLQCEASTMLATNQVAAVMGIVIEAIENVLQHAYPSDPAGKAWVRLEGQGRLRLSIFDMGIGLPHLADHPRPGLTAIEGYANDLSGFARIDNRNYGGTEVAVVFPER